MSIDEVPSSFSRKKYSDVAKLTFRERDDFSREFIAEKIIDLLSSNIELTPMSIDGGWGTGKTEFCCKLVNLIKEKGTHHALYINAFQADHANEPLLTILTEVIKLIPEDSKEKRSKFIKKAIPIFRFGLKTTGKAVFSHISKQDAVAVASELDDVINNATNEAIDASVEAILKDYIDVDKNLTALQKALEVLAEEKPIVLFIDELDRCKPDFAVHMLETIKHVFDVEGLQFVLVCNTQQLKASINHCYGDAVDAQRYLDKFLKFTLMLPEQCGKKHEEISVSIQHFNNLVKDSNLCELVCFTAESTAIHSLVCYVIKSQNLSLREVERLVLYISIYQVLTNGNGLDNSVSYAYKLLRITGIILFCFRQDIIRAMLNNCLDAKELGNFFGEEGIKLFEGHPYSPDTHHLVMIALAPECAKNKELFALPNSDYGKTCKEWIDDIFSPRYYRSRYQGGYIHDILETIKVLCLSK